jgi:hypothetical protein
MWSPQSEATKRQDALEVSKQHLGTRRVSVRLLGRSWPARAIAARPCGPARPHVFGGETPWGETSSRVRRIYAGIEA